LQTKLLKRIDLLRIFTQKNSMRFYSLLAAFLFVLPLVSAQNAIDNAIQKLRIDPELANSVLSISIINAADGSGIAELQPNYSLPSASTAKLFSTAAALELLGADYRPSTRIYLGGKVENGVLRGDLIIRGGGDITLGSRFFNNEGQEADFLRAWVDSLQELGITKITGKIIADGSEFGYDGVPDGWSWSDMGNYYGAGPSGISIFDNAIKFYFKTGSVPGQRSELTGMFPSVSELLFRNEIIADKVNGDNSYIFGAPFSYDRFATGSLPLSQARFEVKGSLPDPEQQLAIELGRILQQRGIQIEQGAVGYRRSGMKEKMTYDTYRLILEHKGPTVQEIATLTNMKSINLFAEGLVCLVGYVKGGIGTTEEGLKQIENYFSKKMSLQGLFLKDGSGLSRSNGISANHFTSLLYAMYQSSQAMQFKNTLPVAGKSGTLSSLCKGQVGEGRITAKSGTMSRIKSYAGYVKTTQGKELIFSITITNYACSNSTITKKMEQVLNAIAVY
jgi:D-alanyl-D-alanine carboxypeptidase/D-alanyl-D-alanine-endopeptidase (penicillin-binding protein 4)